MFTVAGLGNPGEDYKESRHNAGRIALFHFAKTEGFPELCESGKYSALISEGKIKKEKVLLVAPETYMNKSGVSIAKAVKSKKAAKDLIVIHDDLDLPLGKMKIVFARGSGGNRGVESIIKALGTNEFIRIRIGISPTTPSGKLKKPKGEQAVDKFIIGDFKPAELSEIKKVSKKVAEAIPIIILESPEKAMSIYN